MSKSVTTTAGSRFKIVEILVMVAILAASLAIWGPAEEFINIHEGKGWDGKYYFEVAEQIRAGKIEKVMPPYGFRLGHIVLAAYAPIDDLLYSFYYTNLILVCIGGLLLALWLQLRLRSANLRFLAFFFFAWALFGPVRYTTYYPTNAEPLTFALIMLNFLVIEAYLRTPRRRWYALIVLLAAIGSVTRELALIPAFAFAFANLRIDWSAFRLLPKVWTFLPAMLRPFLQKDRLKLYLPIALGIVGTMLLHRAIPESYPFNYLYFAATGWTETNDLRYLASVIAMLGPIVFVVLFRPGLILDWFSRRTFYAVYLVTWLVLGFTNLPDERFFIALLPVLFPLIEATLERYYELGKDVLFWVMTFIFTAVAIRAYLGAPPGAIFEELSLPWWRETFARFLPQSSDLSGIWLYLASDHKMVIATLVVFLLMGWLLWLRAEACRKPEANEGGEAG